MQGGKIGPWEGRSRGSRSPDPQGPHSGSRGGTERGCEPETELGKGC